MAEIPNDAANAVAGMAETTAALDTGPSDLGAALLHLGKQAVEALENALLRTEPDDLRRAEIHERMVDSLLMRHGRDLKDGILAMEHAEKSLELRSTSDSRHLSLRVMSECQYELSRLKNDPKLLDCAIESFENALAATPKDYDNHFQDSRHLSLRVMSESQYKSSMLKSDPELLDCAIKSFRNALAATPEDYNNHYTDSMTLATMFSVRYRWTNNSEDLEESLFVLERSTSMSQMTHVQYQLIQLASCVGLAQLALRKSEPEYLTRAIQLAETVDSTMDANSSVKQMSLMILASFLATTRIFNIPGRSQARDLERASHFLEQASLMSKGQENTDSDVSQFLYSLQGIWACMSRESEKREEVVSRAREQLRLVRADDPSRVHALYHLGVTITERTDWQDLEDLNEADLKEALGYVQEAWRVENANPKIRLRAARVAINLRWASRIYELVYDPEINPVPDSILQDLNHIAECAMRLLSVQYRRDLNRADQQHTMHDISAYGLAADACFISLRSEDTEEALRRIEFGRGMMLGNLLWSRTEPSDLKKVYLGFVKKYQAAEKKAIQTAGNSIPQEISGDVFEERRQARNVVEGCERIIRAIPGFEDFFQPRLEDLRSCIPWEGVVVIVNGAKVESTYADAMIVGESQLVHVPLPDMDLKKALKLYRSHLTRWVPTHGTRSSENFEVRRDAAPPDSDDGKFGLTWLWSTCVRHICSNLIVRNAPPGWLPRVWWMGTGLASSLPFHAAGAFSNGKWVSCLDYMIPSYTSSIRALKFSRDRASKRPPRGGKNFALSLVTMPTTPSRFAPLKGATLEGDGVQATFEGRGKVTRLDNASVDSVLDSMKNADAVHFACHGSSDSSDPSNSHLLLEKAGEVDKLTVASILDTDASSRAGIAFLSACSTAENKAYRLVDEGLHLVNAFQMAGFAHVIGAMRPVDDTACVEISRYFYSNLLNNWHRRDWDRAVAEALRDATLKMRELHPNEPDLWAWYTHTGA
ncbi:CHAT domain-containing protein [Phyllosticta capitalensis]